MMARTKKKDGDRSLLYKTKSIMHVLAGIRLFEFLWKMKDRFRDWYIHIFNQGGSNVIIYQRKRLMIIVLWRADPAVTMGASLLL